MVRNRLARTSGKRPSDTAAPTVTLPRCLAVCGADDDPVAEGPDLVILRFHDINAASLELHRPDVVLSPLVSDAFDCIDLAHALAEAGFRGRYRAVAAHIPDPGLVRREIRACAPEIDFDIILFRPRGDTSAH